MVHKVFRALFALLVTAALTTTAFAQSSTLSGVVVDTAGGVVPGADVVIKHNATGVTTSAVSNSQGAFSFPGVQVGTYTVSVTLQGFKTFVSNDVVLTSAAPASVKAVLEVGGVTETVTVSSSSEIIQTQSSTISSTVNMNQIAKLPMTSRSAMDFVNFLPGVTTADGNRQAQINGLPRGFNNITLDGVNIQDNTLRTTDGFFAIVSPRLDAIEEVTVSTAAQGAEGTSQGATQVRFVTRSGSNDFTGSAYWTFRSDKLNANTWFNNRDQLEKAKLKQNQPGLRVGGPIAIPGLFDGRNKAFFFVNYEEFRQPRESTETRTIFHPSADRGVYRYTVGGGIREVDLLALAAANGQLATVDPTIAGLLAAIRSATASEGSITDVGNPLTQQYRFNVPVQTLNRFPTVRVDYNVTGAHRLTSAWNHQIFDTFPDTLNNREPRFPGFIGAGQASSRTSWSNALRSTFGNVVNELRVAYAGAPVKFFDELGPDDFENQGRFRLDFPIITEPSFSPNRQGRNAWNVLLEDSVNWLKGSHSITAGGSFTHFQLWSDNMNQIPEISFDVLPGDPAFGLFVPANFPGASNTQIETARDMYALLTGRVGEIDADARLENGRYVFMGNARQEARMQEADFWLQDSWRWKPNFTINAGLRYSLQFPFVPLNNSYSMATLASVCGKSGVNPSGDGATACNVYQPGNVTDVTPEYINFGAEAQAYNVDLNNLAPSIGFAWTLGERSGLLGALLGDESVLRGGYARSYSRAGMSDFTGLYDDNPGLILGNDPDRDASNITPPLLLRNRSELTPAPFPETPVYPFTGTRFDTVSIFDENIQVPSADSYSIGLQRALGRNHVIEARYVGTRSRDGWITYNYNETNIVENGFLNEFRLAQANLRANIAAGRGNTFAYTGVPGTSPLPIYLAHFSGVPLSQAGNPALYTSSNFRSSTFINPLAMFNPNPYTNASNSTTAGFWGVAAFRTNMLRAGLPANFWVANPDRANANIRSNGQNTRYDSLQFELRRRLHQGLQFNSSYVFGKGYLSERFSFRTPFEMRRDTGSPGDITHVFKANVVYDLPFGRGRRFASDAGGIMERIVGGWSIGLNARVQTGLLLNLGNVRLVGMTEDDVRDMFKTRIDAAGNVYFWPEEIINETIKAFSVSATSATGYGAQGPPTGRYFAPASGTDCIEVAGQFGECGVGNLVVQGPLFKQFDLAVSKKIALFGSANLELRAEALNVFNQVNFDPVTGASNNNSNTPNNIRTSFGTVVSAYDANGTLGQDGARVLQLIGRFNF